MGQAISYTTSPANVDLAGAGALRGLTISSPEGVRCTRYLGIPYALPPVGEHRWRRPRPLPSNFSYSVPDGSPRDCTRFGTVCEQPIMMAGDKVIGGNETDSFGEDCLLLNIWVPVGEKPDGGWPVYVWLHGGWLQMGNPCHDAIMNPVERIAPVSSGGGGVRAIFVAIGYRVSVLGFLGGKALDSGGNKGGNYGFWDQRCGLEWVHKNIHHFGGNNRRVTLGGQSAGAYSAHGQLIYELLRAPKTEGGLFHNVVLYSSPIGMRPKQPKDAETQYLSLLAAKVKSAAPPIFLAVADDDFFGADLLTSYTDGSFAAEFKRRGMNILIGEMRHEEVFYRKTNTPADWEGLKRVLGNDFPQPVVQKLLDEYLSNPAHLSAAAPDPDPGVGEVEQIYGLIVADTQIRAPTRQLVAALRDGGVPLSAVRRYLISYRHSLLNTPGGAPPTWGATHACDMPIFAFPTYLVMPAAERDMTRAWLQDLADMIAGKPPDFGTRSWTEVKELTRDGTVAVVQDGRWPDLERIAGIVKAMNGRAGGPQL
ncbi:Alpha/Beta hydrolase protein [Mycena rosella]|uniref:Carboxylic ester hydrolase n=1 Tax=Mycena rosella TaxID=1033263 RepID=A0AAD7DE26_MYCRO|nr:Alpha/Beta hydrolase protein [Mycena rosella]